MAKISYIAGHALKSFRDDRLFERSAAMSYYTIFSLVPFLLLLIITAHYTVGEAIVQSNVVRGLEGTIGHDATSAIVALFGSYEGTTGIITTLVTIIVLFVGTSAAFLHLRRTLNTVWGLELKAGLGLFGFLRHRFVAAIVIAIIGLAFLSTIVLTASLFSYTELAANYLGIGSALLPVANLLFSFVALTIVIMVVFKLTPDADIQWRDLLPGSAMTAVLFMVGQQIISYTLQFRSFASGYGVVSAFLIILIWVYYMSAVIFLGAEVTKEVVKEYGGGIVPRKTARFDEAKNAFKNWIRRKQR